MATLYHYSLDCLTIYAKQIKIFPFNQFSSLLMHITSSKSQKVKKSIIIILVFIIFVILYVYN